MARCELDARLAKGARHQIEKRIVRLGQVRVHGLHHLLRGMRARDGQNTGVHALDQIAAAIVSTCSQAAGDDDLAVLRQRFADGVEAFLHGIVNEAAGVDDHQVRAFERLGGLVALGRELREDEFGVGECFRASEGDEPDLGCLGGRRSRGRFVGM